MKTKYIACIWCGGNLVENETPQYRQNSNKSKKPYAKYCSRKCSKKATA